MSLFSTSGVKQGWASRINILLEVPEPAPDDQFSAHICEKCKLKISSLEKAAADLARFRALAKSSLEIRGLKRTKETGGDIGVSPSTFRQRPPSKLARKKLDFASKYSQRQLRIGNMEIFLFHV